jgi:repressor LexA
MPTPILTPRRTAILQYIDDHHREHGFAPTIREIAEHVGIPSYSAVFRHIKILDRHGLIARAPGKTRALVLTDKGRQALQQGPHLPPVGGTEGGPP